MWIQPNRKQTWLNLAEKRRFRVTSGRAGERAQSSNSVSIWVACTTGQRWAQQPAPVFLPEESHGQGSQWAAVHGVAQSQTRLKQLRTHPCTTRET